MLLIPLAGTSTDAMLRKLGPRAWKALHRLIYLIAPLALVHYFLMVKRDTRPVWTVAWIVGALLAWRVIAWVLKNLTRPGRGKPSRESPVRSTTAHPP